MKRHGSRESPSRMKRARGRSPNRRNYRDNSPDYTESRYSSKDARRNIGQQKRHRSPVAPAISPRYNSPIRGSSGRSRRRETAAASAASEDSYNTLVVRNFSSQISRDDIEFSLTEEFRKFGEVAVKVDRDYGGERIAYATFSSSSDARECKNAKGHLLMHERRLQIEVADTISPKYRSPAVAMSPPPPRIQSPYSARSPVRRRSPKRSSARSGGNNARPSARDRAPYHERSPRYSPSQRAPPPSKDRSSSNERFSSRGRYYKQPQASPPPRADYSRSHKSISRSKSRSVERYKSSPRSNGYSPSPDREQRGSPPQPISSQDNQQLFEANFFPGGPGSFLDKAIPPEDDPLATRTLFIGNLEPDVTSHDIRKFLENFGRIDDVDVKRAARGQGAYCFVRFANLDQAYKAKITMNGKKVLNNVVRIGYGKVMMSSKVWVGGLGKWTSLKDLEREFDRFGSIRRVDYRRGDTSGSILYETTDAAKAACTQMRGFLMPGAETRLRMDYLDPEPGMPGYDTYLEWGHHEKNHDERRSGGGDYNRTRYRGSGGRSTYDDRKYSRRDKSPQGRGYRSPARDTKYKNRGSDNNNNSSQNASVTDTALSEMQIKHFHAKSCHTLHDLCQCFDPPCWQGGFILKKIAFPVLFFLLDGDMGVFNRTVADPNSPTGRQTMFHMTQRLKLTEGRVAEVSRRVKALESSRTCIIVAVPGVPENLNVNGYVPSTTGELPTQHKPLRGLVKYFKDKEAAGIVNVPLITLETPTDSEKDRKNSGMLHAFPPGAFATEQLLKIGPSLQPHFFADDYLIIVLVKGSRSALV